MATLAITPASETDADFLQELSQKQRQFYLDLNEMRWEDFNNKNKLFEKTLEDIPATQLPESTQRILLKANAQDWADHVLQAVKTAHIARMKSSDIISTENLWFDKTKIASPINRFPELCVGTSDLQYTDGQLRIASDAGTLTFDIEDGEEKVSELKDTPIYIYKASSGYVLEPYDIISNPQPGVPLEDRPKKEDYQAILRTFAVAASVTAVSQVEPRSENDAFPQLFDDIGLYWEEVETNTDAFDTYLVGTRKRGAERIKSFLATARSDRTISDYCELLGLPESVGNYYCNEDWLEQDYDRYSAEEFALYGMITGDIREEDAQYLLYAPYRPPPEITEVQYAIQYAKQFQEGLKILYNESPTESDYERLMRYYDQHNTQHELLKDKAVIEVYNWLVDCEAAPEPPTPNQD